ncbi:MAG: hypothetical protein IKO46_01635 [Salinivirgaceae bacterium]|nr:hypothetical protein [Salinivirgaceae bacterium]
MTKYNFVLLSGDADDFLRTLQKVGVVDITRSQVSVGEESEAVSARIEQLQKALEVLKQISATTASAAKTDDAAADIISTAAERERIAQQLAAVEAEIADLAPWGDYKPEDIQRLEAAGLKLHFYKVARKAFSEEWSEQYALTTIASDDNFVYFVTVSDTDEYNFPAKELPKPERPIGAAQVEAEKLRQSIAACDARLGGLKSLEPTVRQELDECRIRLDRQLANASAEKAADDYLSVFEGFAPKENESALLQLLDSSNVCYFTEAAQEADNPPIKLKNNRFVSMFEILTDMYGRPKYSEFDPTVWISIFFMLFFAFCMGDAGYGLILALLGFGLKGKLPKIAPLVVTLGVATTVIGLLFHTFFSTDMLTWQCLPDAVKRLMLPSQIAGYDGTMIMAIAVGVVHLCLAMIIKTWQATKHSGLNSLGTWGWTLLIVGGVVVGGMALAGAIDAAVTKVIIIVLGVVSALGIFFLNDLHRNPLANFGVGLWNTYNTATGLLGDVLSYLRLYALGLAGAKLGEAFNAIGTQALGDGGAGWIFFILIVIVGHTLNLAMCVLGAFVHPLRLNFLEFFKNSGYEGTGRRYNPLTENVNN